MLHKQAWNCTPSVPLVTIIKDFYISLGFDVPICKAGIYHIYMSNLRINKFNMWILICRTERKYGVFSKVDACTFVVNVYDEGNVLSIVTDCSPHGTHVAGITAAFHPKVYFHRSKIFLANSLHPLVTINAGNVL